MRRREFISKRSPDEHSDIRVFLVAPLGHRTVLVYALNANLVPPLIGPPTG
jgi:hypothetical protein